LSRDASVELEVDRRPAAGVGVFIILTNYNLIYLLYLNNGGLLHQRACRHHRLAPPHLLSSLIVPPRPFPRLQPGHIVGEGGGRVGGGTGRLGHSQDTIVIVDSARTVVAEGSLGVLAEDSPALGGRPSAAVVQLG
jgi:hypothetical protein